MQYEPKTPLGRAVNAIEETLIAVILGLMTVITFANVIARYVFNANILWALEATVFLFAWLVLIGASYCVKTHTHLGVDVVLNMVSPAGRRVLAIIAVSLCLIFSILLFIGSWNYWAPFIGWPPFFGTYRPQAWYEVNDIPMWEWLRFIEPILNEGDSYEKLPRFIPYAALPLGIFLLLVRFIQLAISVFKGEIDMIIASHEAEEMVEEASAKADKEG